MKKRISYLSLLPFVLTLPITLAPKDNRILSFAQDDSYYVCFSNQNYNVKNTNKMTWVDDHYELQNVTLNSEIDFYIISGNETKYYASDGANMSINENTAYRYNILFSESFIYDANHSDENIEETNSHISYEFYIPGSYSLSINNGSNIELEYNPYQTIYEAYYNYKLDLSSSSTLRVYDNKNGSLVAEKLVEEAGSYRFVFTPGKTINKNDYALDKDGSYGTGEDYTENIYIEDYEYYYVSFADQYNCLDSSKQLFDDVYGYPLIRDNKTPNTKTFISNEFFIGEEKTKVKYRLYYYSPILRKYEELKDVAYDEDNSYSKQTLKNVSWYTITLNVKDDSYTSVFEKKTRDFKGYYMVGNFNHYGYDENGNVIIDEKYKFGIIDQNNTYYEKDYDQYLLSFTINAADLDKDELYYAFVISNGKKEYKNETTEIRVSIVGDYDILFAPDHTYSLNQNYKFNLIDDETAYETVKIDSKEKLVEEIQKMNYDSSYSRYKVFSLDNDLDFKDSYVPQISIFHGRFNGNGHTISNIHYETDEKFENVSFVNLLSQYASIEDVNFKDVNIDAPEAKYVGVIANNYGIIENVDVNGKIKGNQNVGFIGYNGNYDLDSEETTDSTVKYGFGIVRSVSSSIETFGKVNVGGIAGFNGGKIVSSKNSGTINKKSYPSSNNIMNIGGIAGYSSGEIVDTINEGVVGYNNVGTNVGGIAGLATGKIMFSSNKKSVDGKRNTGGLAGSLGTVSSSQTKDYSSKVEDYYNNYLGNNNENIPYTEERDIVNDLIVYSSNTGKVKASNYVGGIIGSNNSQTLIVSECYSVADILATSGSYVGGIVGYDNGATYQSCFSDGVLKSKGTTCDYVGGIAGYLVGKIEYCFSNASIVGGNHLGGIVGFASNDAIINSTYTNVLILGKENSMSLGQIAGEIESINSPKGNFSDKVKYNYFVGYEGDEGGVSSITYSIYSKHAASRLKYTDLLSKYQLSQTLSHHFGEEEKDDEDENKYYFMATDRDGFFPVLVNYYIENEVDNFDEYDDYEEFSTYFAKYRDVNIAAMEKCAHASIKIAYKEWNEDSGEIDEIDSYEITNISEVSLNDEIESYNEFIYATKENGNYYYQGEKAKYLVSYDDPSKEFVNQIICAKYKSINTNLYKDDIFVEGEFYDDITLDITRNENDINLSLTKDNQEITCQNLIVKIKVDANLENEVYVNDEKVSTSLYGEYLKFNLNDSNDKITLISKPKSVSPIVFITLGGAALVVIVTISAIVINKKKKTHNK